MVLKEATILVIDDDVDVLTALRLLLKPIVREVIIEKNPSNIGAQIAQNNFDAIILDMNFKNKKTETANRCYFNYSLCGYRFSHSRFKRRSFGFSSKTLEE